MTSQGSDELTARVAMKSFKARTEATISTPHVGPSDCFLQQEKSKDLEDHHTDYRLQIQPSEQRK
jgi:hypothetical protein